MKKMSDILKIKGGSYNLQVLRIVLKTTNLYDIQSTLNKCIEDDLDRFSYDDVVLDFSKIADDELLAFQNQSRHNWQEWKAILRSVRLNLTGCTGLKDFEKNFANLVENNAEENKTIIKCRPLEDLILEIKQAQISYFRTNKIEHHNNAITATEISTTENINNNEIEESLQQEVSIDEVSIDDNALNSLDSLNFESKYIYRNIRSGTDIREQGNVIIFGDVNNGSQVVSCLDVFIFGELRGKIFAGVPDNVNARIIVSKFNPELIAIAGVYKNFENGIPEEFLNKSVCISLEEDPENDISRLNIEIIKL